MRNITLKLIGILITFLGWFSSNAQDPMALYYLENVPQSNFVNPAMAPRSNVFIGVPGINSIYFNFQTDIPAHVLFQQSNEGTISLLDQDFDYDLLYKKLGKGANIRTYELISPLSFGFRNKIGYFTFSMSEKVKMNMFLASDFFKLTDEGIVTGSSFDFSNTGFDAQLYTEYAIGYSKNIDERLRIGGRLKLLQGLASIKSDFHTMTMKSQVSEIHGKNDAFELQLQGDLYSSGPLELSINEDGIVDTIKLADDFKDFDAVSIFKNYGTNFKNLGFAIDIGATYQLNQDWSFSASLNDLGYIKWKKDLNSVHFNGTYNFVGINVDGSNIDSISSAIQNDIDSIKYAINYSSGNSKYSTNLGTTFHLGAEYHVNHVFSAGFLSRSSFDRNYFHQEFNFSGNLNLYQFLTANINYNFALNGENYFGFGLGLRGGPVQFYLILDHIAATYTNYVIGDGETKVPGPYDFRAFNIMLGFNIILGHHGYRDEPKIDAYSEF